MLAARILHNRRNVGSRGGRVVARVWEEQYSTSGNSMLTFHIAVSWFQILWLGGGLVNLVIFGWWVMEADQGFYQLGLESQYPYPSLGPAAIVGLSFTVVLCFLGIMVSVVSCVEDSQYWTKVRRLARLQIMRLFSETSSN